jgi:hypothetical protein
LHYSAFLRTLHAYNLEFRNAYRFRLPPRAKRWIPRELSPVVASRELSLVEYERAWIHADLKVVQDAIGRGIAIHFPDTSHWRRSSPPPDAG